MHSGAEDHAQCTSVLQCGGCAPRIAVFFPVDAHVPGHPYTFYALATNSDGLDSLLIVSSGQLPLTGYAATAPDSITIDSSTNAGGAVNTTVNPGAGHLDYRTPPHYLLALHAHA